MTTKPSEYLDLAIDVLGSPDQWCKGRLRRTENGIRQHCMGGALATAMGILDNETPDIGALWAYLRTGVDLSKYHALTRELEQTIMEQQPCFSIPQFNDEIETTHADVVAIFEKTRARLQEQGK